MGKPTESGYYIAMAPCIVQVLAIRLGGQRVGVLCQRFKQRNATALQWQFLCMFQWQVGKQAGADWQSTIFASADPVQRSPLCFFVTGKRARRITIDIARKLVQQEQQSQPTARRTIPRFQVAVDRCIHEVTEAAAYLCIEAVVSNKPSGSEPLTHVAGRIVSAKPELEDLLSIIGLHAGFPLAPKESARPL